MVFSSPLSHFITPEIMSTHYLDSNPVLTVWFWGIWLGKGKKEAGWGDWRSDKRWEQGWPWKVSLTHDQVCSSALHSDQLCVRALTNWLWYSDVTGGYSPSLSVSPGGLRSSTDGSQPSTVRVRHLPQGPRQTTSKSKQSRLFLKQPPVPFWVPQSHPVPPPLPTDQLTVHLHRFLPELSQHLIQHLPPTQLGLLLRPAALSGVPRTVSGCPAAGSQPRRPQGVLGQLYQNRGRVDRHRVHRHRETHRKTSCSEENGPSKAAETGAAF